MIEMLHSKIHRATVTETNLKYEGSITISRELTCLADIHEYQKVTVANITNGNRFDTYVIVTEEPGTICVNGAAAHLVEKGDIIIIMSYNLIENGHVIDYCPNIIKVNENNRPLV